MFGRSAPVGQAGPDSATFEYVALNPNQVREKGQMVAPSSASVINALIAEGWTPIDVRERRQSMGNADITAWITGGGVKLKWKARAEFARRLHQMLNAGISVPKALMSMVEDASPEAATMYQKMADRVMAGETLAAAMSEHTRAFDPVTVSYIESGEEFGTLIETTERLAVMLRGRADLQSKITAVTAYPKMVGAAVALIVTGIIVFLVPKLSAIYEGFGADLPAPTKALVWASNHFSPVSFPSIEVFGMKAFYPRPEPFNLVSIVLYIVIGVFIFRRKTKGNPVVGERLDRIRFRMPVFGKLSSLQAMQRWAMTLAGGLASGVPISRAVSLAADASGSVWHQNVAPALIDRIRTGRTLSSELVNHKDLYPPSVRTMMATGEDTGELDTMLHSVADALRSDIDAVVSDLSAKIEVAMLLVLGVVVGALLIALYLPILGMADAASTGLG